MECFRHIGVPIEFETYHLSEVNLGLKKVFFTVMIYSIPSLKVQRGISADLKTVTESIRRNCIALKGVINVPHLGYSGALQNLNQVSIF